MAAHTPLPAEPSGLPLLPVSARALAEFDQMFDRQLIEFEVRFKGVDRQLRIDTRHGWTVPKSAQ